MPERVHVSALPPELLAQVFEGMTSEELRPVMLVCMLWRDIAMDCRSHWQHIGLDSTAPGPLTLFGQLLQRTKGRQFYLSLTFWENSPLLASVVFPVLADHLHHVVFMHVALPVGACSDFLQVLRRPAPLLRVFRLGTLGYVGPEDLFSEVPVDIFANGPGSLDTVRLRNVMLPVANAPAAFDDVVSVRFDLDTPSIVPAPDFLSQFPKVKNLALLGGTYPGTGEYFNPVSVARLQWLSLDLEFYPDFTWYMPLYAIAHVRVVTNLAPWTLSGLLGHILGPLQVAFHGLSAGDFFTMVVGDQEWRQSRTFVLQWKQWRGERVASTVSDNRQELWSIPQFKRDFFFSNYAVDTRTESLTVPHDFLDCAIESFPRLHNVTKLRLSTARPAWSPVDFLEEDYRMTLAFPRLQRLVLHSPSDWPVTLSESTLITFALRVFPPPSLPLPVLALEDVQLELDGVSSLAPYFSAIEHGGNWQYPLGFANPNYDSPFNMEQN